MCKNIYILVRTNSSNDYCHYYHLCQPAFAWSRVWIDIIILFFSYWTIAWYWAVFPWWLSGKESACQSRKHRFDPWVRKTSWRGKWQPSPVFLPGISQGQRNLVSYNSWSRRELDMT